MKRFVRFGWLFAVSCAGFLIAGCASYYQVADPQSGRMYYSQEVETIGGGAVKMTDARTGSVVTLQNSEVKEITEDEYEAALVAPAVVPAPEVPAMDSDPAPAAEATPVPAE